MFQTDLTPQTFEKVLERTPRLPWRELDGVIVVIQPGQNEVHELNGVASLIWKLADGNHTRTALLNQVCEHFEVRREIAQKDMTELLTVLTEKGLLSERDPSPSAS